MMMPLKF
jgi:hypothetical protein